MPACQIVQIAHDDTYRWKWRHVSAEGVVTESAESYAFHYQCAAAARHRGYRPDMKWLPAGASPAD